MGANYAINSYFEKRVPFFYICTYILYLFVRCSCYMYKHTSNVYVIKFKVNLMGANYAINSYFEKRVPFLYIHMYLHTFSLCPL
jgi:hypothetical protein